jgi:hypothetical protein
VTNAEVRPVEAEPAAPTAPEVVETVPPSKLQPATTAPARPVEVHTSPELVKEPAEGVVRLAERVPAKHMVPATSRQPGAQLVPHAATREGKRAPAMRPPEQMLPPGQAKHTPVPLLK